MDYKNRVITFDNDMTINLVSKKYIEGVNIGDN